MLKRFLVLAGVAMVLGLLRIVAVIGVEADCGGYPDVTTTSAYCPAIEYVQGLNVMTGQGSGAFLPDSTLTRAEAAAVLTRYLGETPATKRTSIARFADADSKAWYAGHFEILLDRKIFEGYPDGSLRPGGTLTRAEWLKLFYVTNGLAGSEVEREIADVPDSKETDWYRLYLNDAVANGFLDLQANKFAPGSGQKRKLVADLIYRIDGASGFAAQSEIQRDPVVASKDAIYASRFGALASEKTVEAAIDLPFGYTYPNDYLAVWPNQVSFNKIEDFVDQNQDLGKTVVVKVGFDASATDSALVEFESWVTDLVERFDGDGTDDWSKLDLAVRYWQFDNDDLSAVDFGKVAQAFAEGVRAADAKAQLIRGLQHSDSASQQEFWREVMTVADSSFDILAVKALDRDAFGMIDYINLVGKSRPIWLFEAKISSGVESEQAGQLFKRTLAAFGEGADRVFYTGLESGAGLPFNEADTLVNSGNRKDAYFAWETLLSYLDAWTKVERQGANRWLFTIGSKQVWAGAVASEAVGKIGVDYLGNELNDVDPLTELILVW